MMDMMRTIERLGGPECFIVERRDAGTIVNGRHVRAEAYTFKAEGAVQNSDADTIAMLPEGVRTNDIITIWTNAKLRTAEDDKHEADRITVRDVVWEVHQVKTWQREGNFFRAVCVKVGQ